jgi:hypothetical protein
LWFQKKLQKIPFSTLKFLKRSEAKRFGWLRFREIVILILRCLFISFLFLSLAKPQIKGKIFGADRLASVVLIIDNSYSMSYGDNLRLAKQTVQELLALYSMKSEFFVTPLCDIESSKESGPYWVTKKSAQELVKKIRLTHASGDISQVLSNISTSEARYPVEYVYIGDGQEINFHNLQQESIEGHDFYWLKIPLGRNIGISNVTLKDPVAIPLDDYSLNVDITNFSSQPWFGKVTVSSGHYYYEQDCEVQPTQDITLEFLLPLFARHGKIVLYDDSLLTDNVYYFSKSLSRQLNVLIVGEKEFLMKGLTPTGNSESPFSVEAVSTLSSADLRKFDVVILNGIHDISASDKIKIENFTGQGEQSVICFLGDKVGENLRELIGRCCTVEEPLSPKGYVTLDWVDYMHPIFNVFVGSPALKNIKFYHFQKMNAQKGIIAKLTGNYPFIVIDSNFVVVATHFAHHTTDIIYKASFIPLLYRMIVSTSHKSYEKEFYVGQKVPALHDLKTPTGEYLTSGREFLVPGFYTTDGSTVSVNVIPDEGNTKIMGDEMANILQVQTVDLEKDLARGDLSTMFLYLALLVFLLELGLLLIY